MSAIHAISAAAHNVLVALRIIRLEQFSVGSLQLCIELGLERFHLGLQNRQGFGKLSGLAMPRFYAEDSPLSSSLLG